jgi:hypothetical protein
MCSNTLCLIVNDYSGAKSCFCMSQVGNMPFGSDFGSQAGNAMQIDRGSSWMPGPSENLAQYSGPPGPSSMVSGQMGAANQPPRPPAVIIVN